MLLLLNPWVQRILLVVALIAGYAYWANYEKAIGAASEQAREATVAIQHEQKVDATAESVDQAVSQDQSPQDTLNKQWSQP